MYGWMEGWLDGMEELIDIHPFVHSFIRSFIHSFIRKGSNSLRASSTLLRMQRFEYILQIPCILFPCPAWPKMLRVARKTIRLAIEINILAILQEV